MYLINQIDLQRVNLYLVDLFYFSNFHCYSSTDIKIAMQAGLSFCLYEYMGSVLDLRNTQCLDLNNEQINCKFIFTIFSSKLQ